MLSSFLFIPALKVKRIRGLCTGTENFFCINKEASAEDQAASIAFVEWLFSSETGKQQ